MICDDIFIGIFEFSDLEKIYMYQTSNKYLYNLIIGYLQYKSMMKTFMEWCADNCKFNTLYHLLNISSDADVIDISLNKPVRKNCLKTVAVLLSDSRIKTYTLRICICKYPYKSIAMLDNKVNSMFYEDNIETIYQYPDPDSDCVVCFDVYQNYYGINSKETSALHIAVTHNYMEMFKLLLSHSSVCPMTPDNLPLLSAIKNQNLDMVRSLLNYKNLDVTYYEDDPLYEALRIGNPEILIMLFQHPKFNFEYISATDIIQRCSNMENSQDILNAFNSRKIK